MRMPWVLGNRKPGLSLRSFYQFLEEGTHQREPKGRLIAWLVLGKLIYRESIYVNRIYFLSFLMVTRGSQVST